MKVRLTEYDTRWVKMYEDETRLLKAILGEEIICFEHFGSTAVPGMKAKPVIDMMIMVRDIETIDRFSTRMVSLGYDAAGEWGIPGRRLFRKGGEQRTHHIHIYQWNNPHISRHLIVRDYLRIHPEEVKRYNAMKEELAQRYEDTSGYSQAKKPFVQDMETRALKWYATQNRS